MSCVRLSVRLPVFPYSHRGMNADSRRIAAFIAKKYKSHRDIPLFVGKTLDNLKKEFVDSQNT